MLRDLQQYQALYWSRGPGHLLVMLEHLHLPSHNGICVGMAAQFHSTEEEHCHCVRVFCANILTHMAVSPLLLPLLHAIPPFPPLSSVLQMVFSSSVALHGLSPCCHSHVVPWYAGWQRGRVTGTQARLTFSVFHAD